MAQQTDVWKRYLDAGLAFTQLTRSRAEAIVKDLVKAGAVQREKTEKAVEDLMDRSRKNSDMVMELIRKEVRSQLSNLGFATKDDVARLERRIDNVAGKAAARAAAKSTSTAAKTTTKAATKAAKAKKATGPQPAPQAGPPGAGAGAGNA